MIEFFAGVGILCAIAKQHNMTQSFAVDKVRKRGARSAIVTLDLTRKDSQDLVQQWLNSSMLCWAHFAPVNGEPWQPRPLRSCEAPDGLPNLTEAERQRVGLANDMYDWTCVTFITCTMLGILATIENPHNSYFWLTTFYKKLLESFTPYLGIFQSCMYGGARPKWTRVAANFKIIESLSLSCDGRHTHAKWGKTFDPETGKEVFATSLEAQYPRKLCIALVHVVLQQLHSQGLMLDPESLQALTSSPHHRSQISSLALAKQPRGNKIPPVVPEYSHVATIPLEHKQVPPVEVLQKLPAPWKVDHIDVPKGARLLRCTHREGGTVEGVQTDPTRELAFGIPWTPEGHISAAVNAGHPLDLRNSLPDALRVAVTKHLELGATAMAEYRIDWCRRWMKRALQLKHDERLDRESRPKHVAHITSGKRIRLLGEMLDEIEYTDKSALQILEQGSTLAGEVAKVSYWADSFKPAMMTVDQLERRACGYNQYMVSSVSASGDSLLDEAVWAETKKELERSWIDGPWELASLPSGAVVSRRFGLRQGNADKVRVIDDFSCSGVNDTCQTHSKPELHAVDCFCGLVKHWFSECRDANYPAALAVKTYDLKSAYRQVPVMSEHLKYGFVCVYNTDEQRPQLYRMLTLPFGASHSVYSFLRLSRMIFEIASRSLYVLNTNFYDDFVLASPVDLQCSAARSFELLLSLTGWIYATDGKKATVFQNHCEALGVKFDLADSGKLSMLVCNTEKRVKEICSQLESVAQCGKLEKKTALQLRGRLGFADTYLHGRFGAILMAYLMEHAYSGRTSVDEELMHVLTVLYSRLQLNKPKTVTAGASQKFFIYSDASFENASGGLGGVLLDSLGHVVQWFGVNISVDLCRLLGSDQKDTIIFELELLASILAVGVWSELLRESQSIIFIDNEAVRFCMIRARSQGGPSLQLLKFYVTLEADLGLILWCARVSSEANIADFPSRSESHPLLRDELRIQIDIEAFLKTVGISLDP